MSDYSEEDWRKWGERFGWKLNFCTQVEAYFETQDKELPMIIVKAERQAIDSVLSAKDSLIAELTKERDDAIKWAEEEGKIIQELKDEINRLSTPSEVSAMGGYV